MKLTLEEAKQIMDENYGNLDLKWSNITELPDNLTVKGYLDISDTKITSLPKNLTVRTAFYMRQTAISNLPNDLTVGGPINLENSKIASLPNNLTINGYLDLANTSITRLPNGLVINGSLYCENTQITSVPSDLIVDGSLCLENSKITNLPHDFTIGCSLHLNNTNITNLPNNLTVGNRLEFYDTQITKFPENLTVGYCILDNKNELIHRHDIPNGTYVPNRYLYADNILTHVRKAKKIGRYTYYVGKIKNKNVISDGVNYAHCTNFREGIADLAFKAAKDRGSEQYNDLTLDSIVSFEDAVTMYRIITGACKQGTQMFIDNLKETKDNYSVREIIETTDGNYGSNVFKKFFEK